MNLFQFILDEARTRWPTEKPMRQHHATEVRELIGERRFKSMIEHPYFKHAQSDQEQAFKHGVTAAGFHRVEVYPYSQHHKTESGAFKPEKMIRFDFNARQGVDNAHLFRRPREEQHFKHMHSHKETQ